MQKGEGPQSASSIDKLHPFDRFATQRSCQKWEGEPPATTNLNIEFIVQLLAHKRETYCLCPAAMMLLNNIHHNVYVI